MSARALLYSASVLLYLYSTAAAPHHIHDWFGDNKSEVIIDADVWDGGVGTGRGDAGTGTEEGRGDATDETARQRRSLPKDCSDPKCDDVREACSRTQTTYSNRCRTMGHVV